jgi:hypothetical protein
MSVVRHGAFRQFTEESWVSKLLAAWGCVGNVAQRVSVRVVGLRYTEVGLDSFRVVALDASIADINISLDGAQARIDERAKKRRRTGDADWLQRPGPPRASREPRASSAFDLGAELELILGEEEAEEASNIMGILQEEQELLEPAEPQGGDADGVIDEESDDSCQSGDFKDIQEGDHVVELGDDGQCLQPPTERPSAEQSMESRTKFFKTMRLHGAGSVCSRLSLEYSSRNKVVTDCLSGKRCGKLHHTFGGRTWIATCDRHQRCKLMLDEKPALGFAAEQVEADLLSWLAAGCSMGAASHRDLGTSLKKDVYKMRVRG